MLHLIPLIAAIAPFFLWPIEIFLPYPFIIEEIAKAIIIIPLRDLNRTAKFKLAVVVGFLFAISESTLYIFNIAKMGNTVTFIQRLFLTTPLHITTVAVILFFASKRGKVYFILGVLLASVIHLLFNYFVRYI
jgi:RsiW-degrading membrane proteinase PrsW (M82 family)